MCTQCCAGGRSRRFRRRFGGRFLWGNHTIEVARSRLHSIDPWNTGRGWSDRFRISRHQRSRSARDLDVLDEDCGCGGSSRRNGHRSECGLCGKPSCALRLGRSGIPGSRAVMPRHSYGDRLRREAKRERGASGSESGIVALRPSRLSRSARLAPMDQPSVNMGEQSPSRPSVGGLFPQLSPLAVAVNAPPWTSRNAKAPFYGALRGIEVLWWVFGDARGRHRGGGSGIRTRGGLLTHTRFPGVRLKPLIHPSAGTKAAILAAGRA